MDSSSTQTLFDLSHEEATIPWTESHLSAVHGYVLKLEFSSSHFRALNYVKNRCPDQAWYRRFGPGNDVNFSQMMALFAQELREIFLVPKFRQSHQEKNEIVADFIDFLLQLLHHEIDLNHSFGDRIGLLKKELRFLVTVLGDKVWLGGEVGQVENLLAEFEAVANEAGRLVCSFIFATDGVFLASRMDKALVALFENIDLLKADITSTFLILPPYVNKVYTVIPTAAAADSFLIVDSLLYDLEDLMNREDDRIVDVKGQIKILHQELMLSQSLLKDVKARQDSKIEAFKEPMVRIRDVAYEAKYLINSFLVGDAPLWYLTIRLTNVMHKIKHIGIGLQEIKKNYDRGA